ncbi:thiolase family protein [Mesorhizobium sp. CO1-1-8]|uniref:thiolase family protein n=1 Tax=Mesorhizobium sp. CO1-1-8 TaxID=2876631 RepID=UPI001CD0C86D|nr:thiolase family protein [Mesorhizobium sp. CO1-1-8]MBZ9772383.1 thiolase family protein [Mesorhizobium sp. CO1-1-8]
MSQSNRRGVAVIGVGLVPFDKYENETIEEIARPAVISAMRDAGFARNQIESAFVSHVYQGEVLGQRILRGLGFADIPITNIENACAGGSTAVREAFLSIAHGVFETALVIGAEKMGRGLINFLNPDIEQTLGNIAPAQYAMAAQRHIHEFDTPRAAFAEIAVKSRRHASLNPNARFRDRVTRDEVLASRPIAEPMTLLECCRNGSGAAALVLVSEEKVRSIGAKPIWILGSGLGSWMFDNTQHDLTNFGATRAAAKAAYEASGLGPDDLDIVELHDAFTAGELLHYEGLGLCAKGEGGRLALDGATALGGRIPVNVSGGLISKSHPLGATGVAQICELTWQLRGEADGRQVEGARIALAHSQGGTTLESGASCVTVLGKGR